jgi:hypothetical protein
MKSSSPSTPMSPTPEKLYPRLRGTMEITFDHVRIFLGDGGDEGDDDFGSHEHAH